MRRGVQFATQHEHERFHTDPLQARLSDITVTKRPAVVVSADTRPPTHGAWNVQIFHGLGDKQYTGNPLYLQRRRFPRARTAANMLAGKIGAPTPFLRPPENPGKRGSRYDQVNAYGPRFRDRFEAMLDDALVSMHGHPALNETGGVRYDKKGPVAWFPTWDNRAYMGGPRQSSLAPFGDAMLKLAERFAVRVKFHPLTVAYNQDPGIRNRLDLSNAVEVLRKSQSPYEAMQGVRAVVTDTSSLAFEAACCGIPVVVLQAERWQLGGLHDELESRVPVIGPKASVADAILAATPVERSWREDLLLSPDPAHNAAFAAGLRERANG